VVEVDTARRPNFLMAALKKRLGYDQTLAPYTLIAVKPDQDPSLFWARVTDIMASADGERGMVLYIHGYNNSFEDAARRAAQLSFDLEMPGRVALFSWPSKGSTAKYTYDEATIDASEWALQDFMVKLARTAGPGNLHVIAHSMGNRAFLRALERTLNDASVQGGVRFGQVILAAPDVDTAVFNHLAPLLARPVEDGQFIAAGATVYVARNDDALWFSRVVHSEPRAGRPPPLPTVGGVTVVDIHTKGGVLDLGHSDYATVEPVVLDIKSLIRLGQPSNARRPLPPPDVGFSLGTSL
jgi:esterase/lipase superfamily enzyme